MLAMLAETVRSQTSTVDGLPQQHCPICVAPTPWAATWRWCPTCEESWRDPTPEEISEQEGTA